MKIDLNKVSKYKVFLEAMLEKSSKDTVEKFTKEELSNLSKLIPGFDFQIADVDKRLKIIGAIEAVEILLDTKMQQKLQSAQSWGEIDRMTMGIMADREIEEYNKSKDKQKAESVKQKDISVKDDKQKVVSVMDPDATVGVPTTAKSGSSEKWHQGK